MADLNIEQIVAQVLAEMKGAEAPKVLPTHRFPLSTNEI